MSASISKLMIRNAETMWRMHFFSYPQLFTRCPLNFNPLVCNLLSFCILWNEKHLQLHVDAVFSPVKSDHYWWYCKQSSAKYSIVKWALLDFELLYLNIVNIILISKIPHRILHTVEHTSCFWFLHVKRFKNKTLNSIWCEVDLHVLLNGGKKHIANKMFDVSVGLTSFL